MARSEKVFRRLQGSTSTTTTKKKKLSFDVIALTAVSADGEIDEVKLANLIALFRPGRDGTLTLLDFAKSIDSVYKDIKTLRAAVESTSRMDRAFERAVNFAFYLVVGCAVLYAMGIDPFLLFTTFSSFILGLAFAFGPAASKYFEVSPTL